MWERNARDDTFGFGVVLSDETLGGIEHADPRVSAQLHQHSACWDDIDIRYRGTTSTCGGHGFSAISRKTFLLILQQRCVELGVDLRFRAEASDVDRLAAEYDVVLAADGANSAIRAQHAEVFGPSLERRHAKYK